MTTPPSTAERFRRAGGGDNTEGGAGDEVTPAFAVDTTQEGLLDVPVQQPAEGQEANMMATPEQPRQQALDALSGGEVYQPAVLFDTTPGPAIGGPTMGVGASNAPASPASPMPAVPTVRAPAVGADAATAVAGYEAATVQSSTPIDVRVIPLHAAQVSMPMQPQVPLGSARLADLQRNTNVGGSVPTVPSQPTAGRGAPSDVIVSVQYLDDLHSQLREAQEEMAYLRNQLANQLQPPETDADVEENPVPVDFDTAPLKDAVRKQLAAEVKDVFKTLVLKADDSVSIIHSKVTRALVRLGAVDGGSQFQSVAAEALQLVPDLTDRNPLQTARLRRGLRHQLGRTQLTREDQSRLQDVSVIDRPGLRRELQVMAVIRSSPLLQEIDKAAKQALVLNCPAKYLTIIAGTPSFLGSMQLIIADIGLTAQQQMQAMVQRLTAPRLQLMGELPDAVDVKPFMLSLTGLAGRILGEIATRTFTPVGAASITPFGIAAWSAAQNLPTPVDPNALAAVYLPEVKRQLFEQVTDRHASLETLAASLHALEDRIGAYQAGSKQLFKPVAAAPQMVLAMTDASSAEVRRAAPVGAPVRQERVKAKWETQQAVDARLERVGAELRGRPQQNGGRSQEQPRRPSLSPGAPNQAGGRQPERYHQQGGKQGEQQRSRAEKVPTPTLPPKSLKTCWAFNTDQGCPFGDNCRFSHDEQQRPQQRPAGRSQGDTGGRGQPQGGRLAPVRPQDSRQYNRLGLHGGGGVKFVGKMSDECQWPTAREAAELTAAQRIGLRSGRRVPQCLPVAPPVLNADEYASELPALLAEEEECEEKEHALTGLLDGKTLPAGTVLLDSCSGTNLMQDKLIAADGCPSKMVLKGVGPGTVKAASVVDIKLTACFSYQNEPPAMLPPLEVHTVPNMQECLLLSQGQLAQRGCDFITPNGVTNEGCIILPPDHKGRRLRVKTAFNEQHLLVVNEPLCIASATGASHLFSFSDHPVYHIDMPAFEVSKTAALPALELRNAYVIKNVKKNVKPVPAKSASTPALRQQSTRQLRSATVRTAGQPSASVGVAKVHVKSVMPSVTVKGPVPKKELTVSAPQVAQGMNSVCNAPVGEALLTVKELITLPNELCVPTPQIGAAQVQPAQAGDGKPANGDGCDGRLSTLLPEYGLSAYVTIFEEAGYKWVTDFPSSVRELKSECGSLWAQMRKPEWKRLETLIADRQRGFLALIEADPSAAAASSTSVDASKLEANPQQDVLVTANARTVVGGSPLGRNPWVRSLLTVVSANNEPGAACVGCDADLHDRAHVQCSSGLRHGDSPCINALHTTCSQKGSIDTRSGWICSRCVVKFVTDGLHIPVGEVRHVYCVRAASAPTELPCAAVVESNQMVVSSEIGEEVLLRAIQRCQPGWLRFTYADVARVAGCSQSLRHAIMGPSAAQGGPLNPFTHLLPEAMLRTMSPDMSPKLFVESIGGWHSTGQYSYPVKHRVEVITVLATVAPTVSVSFTDLGFVAIRARVPGEHISPVTAKVIAQAQQLLQRRYGQGNLPGSVYENGVCYRCLGGSKYDLHKCAADGCTLHVHFLCTSHVPPRCWCPHNAAETDMGKSRPHETWFCARHDPQGNFDERVESFKVRSMANQAYKFPRQMCRELHDCPACLIQEVPQVGRGDTEITAQRWWPHADDLQCLFAFLKHAGVDVDDVRDVVRKLTAKNLHIGDLWTITAQVLTGLRLDDYTVSMIARAARIHCAVMEHLIDLGGRNTRIPDGDACIPDDYYQHSYNQYAKLQRVQEQAQYDRERREAMLAFIQPREPAPVPVFMVTRAAAPVTPAAGNGYMPAPVPQAPRRRDLHGNVRYITIQDGVMSSRVRHDFDFIVVRTHCLGPQVGYSGEDAAARSELRYCDRFSPTICTMHGIKMNEPGTVTICYPQAPARADQPGVVLLYSQLFHGASSIRVLDGSHDTAESRMFYDRQCLQALAAAIPERAAVAFADDFQPDCQLQQRDYLEAWAASNPGLNVCVVSRLEQPPARVGDPRQDGSGQSGAGPSSTPRDRSPSRRTSGSGHSGLGSAYPRPSSTGASQGSTSHRGQQQTDGSARRHLGRSATAMPTSSAAGGAGRNIPAQRVCRYAQRNEVCPYQSRPDGCKYFHPLTQSHPATRMAAPPLPSRAQTVPEKSMTAMVPFMHPSITGLPELQHYLDVPSVANTPARLAGRRYLERPDLNDKEPIVIYEWGAKTFSAGKAIVGIPGLFYVACDLYPPDHPHVIAMLARHNVAGTTAIYVQGQIGTAPSWKQLANLLRITWGFTLHNLRVYLASPDCTTVSSAPLNRYSGRDATNGFAPVSQQAQLDDKTREAVMRTADNIADILKVRGVQKTFTAIVEQPRSGIASQVAAIKNRMMFHDWFANHIDNCQFADQPSSMKPSTFYTRGPMPRFDVTCRPDEGTGCEWRQSDGTHIVAIVDYNPSRQIRLPDGHVGRSLVHPEQYAALIAMALAGQRARQQHAAGGRDSGQVNTSTPSNTPATTVPVLTARIAGRVARLEDTPLTAKQLHQATLHVDPRRVLQSIPSWSSGLTIRAKSGVILAAPKIQLRDLQIEGTCDTCARGKLKATGSSHTSHQRDDCRRQRAKLAAQGSPKEQPVKKPNRSSPRFTGMVNT